MLQFFYVSKTLKFMSVSKTFNKGPTPHSEWALQMFHQNFSCSFLSQKGKRYCCLCLWEKHQKIMPMRLKHFVGVEQAPKEVHSLRHCYSRWRVRKLRGGREYKSYFKSSGVNIAFRSSQVIWGKITCHVMICSYSIMFPIHEKC